jgi:hypothetical protein
MKLKSRIRSHSNNSFLFLMVLEVNKNIFFNQIVFIICIIFIVIFNIVGFFAAFKKIYFLSVIYAVYLYFISFTLFVNCSKSMSNLIPGLLNSLMSIIVSNFIRGLRERRLKPTTPVVGVEWIQNEPYCTVNGVYQLQPINNPLHLTNTSESSFTNNFNPRNPIHINPNYSTVSFANY